MYFFKILLFALMMSIGAKSLAAGCPFSSEEPKLVLRTRESVRLIVCGFEEKEKPIAKNKKQMSEFKVYSQKNQEEPKEIWSVGALENYLVSAIRDGLLLEEMWWLGDKYHPSLKYEIKCDRKECSIGGGSCVLKAPKNPYPKIIKEIKKRLHEKDLGGAPYLDAMMIKAFAQALSGDSEAQDFFLEKNRPSRLDGAFGEEWQFAKLKLEKAKKAGCLE